MGPGPLGPHFFPHVINAIGVKITPVFKMFMVFISLSILTIFAKCSRVLNMPGFWIYYDSKYVWVLNISGSWIWPWFWICQGSEQTKVLNKPGFWIYQGSEYASGSEYFRVTQGSVYAWICLIMSNWICLIMSNWICLILSEYAAICTNMPKSAWMAFALDFSIVIPCLLERVITYFDVYAKLEVLVWRKMRLFSWEHTVWFNSCMYLIWFLF